MEALKGNLGNITVLFLSLTEMSAIEEIASKCSTWKGNMTYTAENVSQLSLGLIHWAMLIVRKKRM